VVKVSNSELQSRIIQRCDVVDAGHASPCWISNRAAQPNGYTKIGLNGKTLLVHRLSYELEHGPIPDGLVIDHLCRNRACANPDHLEAVTMRENLLRGDTVTAAEVAQTHCLNGHEFTPSNTYLRPDRVGRVCRACSRDRAERYRAAS
jgi:hypothetical protein